MTRTDHLRRVLDEFRVSPPPTAPLTIETVWHRTWTPKEARAFNRKSGWKKVPGVYLFVDFCTRDDIHGESTDERFSVIRRIGKADSRFADRMNKYCHRDSGEPETRFSWYKWDGCYHKWFRYSQIDIIRADTMTALLLETFLLNHVPTQCNDKNVPASLKGNPIIYDAQSGSETGGNSQGNQARFGRMQGTYPNQPLQQNDGWHALRYSGVPQGVPPVRI